MSDLCTLDDVKGYLQIDVADAGADAVLTRLVSSASLWLQGQIGREIPIPPKPYTETLCGDGTSSILLRNYPVVAVTSLTVDGMAIQPRTATEGGYVLQDDRVWLSGPSGDGSGGLPGPLGPYVSITRMTTLRFTVGNANVAVTYSAGYPSLPADLQQATIELAAETYKRRDRLGIMSKTIGGEAVTFQTLSLGAGLSGLIDAYRRPRL